MASLNTDARLRLIFFSALAGSLFGVALFSTASKADFLDDLFGFDQGPATPHYFSRPRPRHMIVVRSRPHVSYLREARRERPRKVQAAFFSDRREDASPRSAAGSDPVRPAFCTRAMASRTMSLSAQLLRDSTLRRGDIVATTAGLRVFRGNGACPHMPRDFMPLAGSDLSRGRLHRLAGLEVLRRGSGD
jgi:hypothetical protein